MRNRRALNRIAKSDFQAKYIKTVTAEYFQVPTYTDAQRGALSPEPGWHVFDTDANKPLWYDGTNWRDGVGTIVP